MSKLIHKLNSIADTLKCAINTLDVYRDLFCAKLSINYALNLIEELRTPEKSRKAQRNLSDDKCRNLKRKFRAERSIYPYHWEDLNKDLLEERQRDVELGDPIYVKWMSPETGRAHKYAVTSVEFKPKPLPG